MSVIPDYFHEEAKVNEGGTNDGTPAFNYRFDVLWWCFSHFQCASFHKLVKDRRDYSCHPLQEYRVGTSFQHCLEKQN